MDEGQRRGLRAAAHAEQVKQTVAALHAARGPAQADPGQPVVHKFTDAKRWGGVADYEYSPYTVFSTGEGKRAQYSITKTDSSETPRVIFAEKDANASIEMIGDTIYAWTNAGCAERSPAPKGQRGEARVQDWEADRRRAEGTWCLNHSW